MSDNLISLEVGQIIVVRTLVLRGLLGRNLIPLAVADLVFLLLQCPDLSLDLFLCLVQLRLRGLWLCVLAEELLGHAGLASLAHLSKSFLDAHKFLLLGGHFCLHPLHLLLTDHFGLRLPGRLGAIDLDDFGLIVVFLRFIFLELG